MTQLLKLALFVGMCLSALYGLLLVNPEAVYFGGPLAPLLGFTFVAICAGCGLGCLWVFLGLHRSLLFFPAATMISSGHLIPYVSSTVMADSMTIDAAGHFLCGAWIMTILVVYLMQSERWNSVRAS